MLDVTLTNSADVVEKDETNNTDNDVDLFADELDDKQQLEIEQMLLEELTHLPPTVQ